MPSCSKKGLLSLLPQEGFEIKRLTPDGSFEAYTYPFASDAVSQTSSITTDTETPNPPLLIAFEQMQEANIGMESSASQMSSRGYVMVRNAG